jgi:hypothetical protein
MRFANSFVNAAIAALFLVCSAGRAATFTYHGSLQDNGKAADGRYDLELTLYASAEGGSAVGGPLLLHAVPVHAGGFSAEADFGPLANVAGTAWLGVKVRPAGSGDFAELSTRAPVSAEETASVCPGAWTIDGNAGTTSTNYLGTADSQPLILRTAGQTAMTIGVPSTDSNFTGTNIVSGYSGNVVTGGAIGVTVAGGGTLSGFSSPNSASGDFATIGGGASNMAGEFATVAGGVYNSASGGSATVAGGQGNSASDGASVAGGLSNVASGSAAAISGGSANEASNTYAFVGGGLTNVASGFSAVVAGGGNNQAGGDYSFAGGTLAKVRDANEAGNAANCANANSCGDAGSFVWSDGNFSAGTSHVFASTGPQQFLVHAEGGVGINTAPPVSTVELTIAPAASGNDAANLFLRQRSIGAGIMLRSSQATSTANNDAAFAVIRYNGSVESADLTIDSAGVFQVYNATAIKPTGTTWSNPSDARLKRDVRPLENTLDRVLQLRGVTFEYANPDQGLHPAGRHTGFIAQEVQQVFPDWVGSTPDGYLTVGPNGFEAMTVEALRDLRAEKDAEVSALRDALAAATARNAAMQTALDDLAARMLRLEAAREH